MNKPIAKPTFDVEPSDESTGHCDCCGHHTRCIWGFIHRDDATVAAYRVRWTENHVLEKGHSIDFVVGPWGDDTFAEDRFAVSLLYRRQPDKTWSFMVVDAKERPADDSLASVSLRRDEVIGTPLAPQIFALIDALYLQDGRLAST